LKRKEQISSGGTDGKRGGKDFAREETLYLGKSLSSSGGKGVVEPRIPMKQKPLDRGGKREVRTGGAMRENQIGGPFLRISIFVTPASRKVPPGGS